MRRTFKVYERLKRKQHIDTLFHTGKAFSVFPVKVIYLSVDRGDEEIAPARAGFSVSKKKFRKAVHRQRVKRLMREVWRLRKNELYEFIPAGKQLHLFFIFQAEVLPEYEQINAAIAEGIKKLKSIVSKS